MRAKGLLVALVGVFLVACGHDPASPPPPQTQRADGAADKLNYELSARCGDDARSWYKANVPSDGEPIRSPGGGSITSAPMSYDNHYSRKEHGCFAHTMTYTVIDSGPGRHGKNDGMLQTDEIWNVNENRRMGVLVQKDLTRVTACEVRGRKCATKEEFEGLIDDFLYN